MNHTLLLATISRSTPWTSHVLSHSQVFYNTILTSTSWPLALHLLQDPPDPRILRMSPDTVSFNASMKRGTDLDRVEVCGGWGWKVFWWVWSFMLFVLANWAFAQILPHPNLEFGMTNNTPTSRCCSNFPKIGWINPSLTVICVTRTEFEERVC